MNFDLILDRRHSDSIKWQKYPQDVLPMWVADMDFRSPPAVIAALHERVEHGVFGYGQRPPPALTEAVLDWLARSYRWQVDESWLIWLPGLVCGLNVCCHAFGEPGDDVLSTVPVYYHLFRAPTNAGRRAVTAELAYQRETGRWSLDFDALRTAVTPRSRLFMLCNPHNPVGRVYRREELLALAEFCERHDLILCSDEIHCQLVLDPEKTHLPIASLDAGIAARTVTLMAPSKTYNVPGLGCAFAVIPDPALRRQFVAATTGIVPHINVLSYTAALAAYRDGGPWLEQLLEYLRGNRARLAAAIDRLPGLTLSPTEATYLGWIDARDTGLDDPAGFFERAGVGLSDGAQYKAPGFLRLNFACPRAQLAEALERIGRALSAASSGV